MPKSVLLLVALSIATAIALLWVHPQYINPDTAQHVSVARNLLDGAGFSTSILYYEEQYALAQLPAPQTLWPPGYPVLIAALTMLGMPAVLAAFALAIAGHLAVSVLIFCIGAQIGLTRRACLLISLAWLALLAPATLPLTAFTEPVFTAFTLAALLALGRAWQDTREAASLTWFWLAGLAAAAAFAIRYTGVTFIGAVGIVLLARWLASPSWRRLQEGLAFSLIPVLLCAAILLRNTLLTGEVTGGPAVASQAGLLHVVQSLYWAALGSLGVFGSGLEYDVVELLIVSTVAVSLFLAYHCVRLRAVDTRARNAQRVLWVTGVYVALTSALLVFMALGRSPDLIQWRYIVPLLPFALLSVGAALSSPWLRDRRRTFRVAVSCCFAAASVLLLTTQRHVLEQWDTRYVKAQLAREAATILEARFDGAGLQQVLDDEGDARTPILTQDGQVLGALLTQPVLGTPSPYYTTRTWTEREVIKLVDTYDVGWVLFLPRFFHPTGANDRNKVFFADIARGHAPDWLRLVHRTDQIELYSIDRTLLKQSQSQNK